MKMTRQIAKHCANLLNIPDLYPQRWVQRNAEGQLLGDIVVENWWLITLGYQNELIQNEELNICRIKTDKGSQGILLISSTKFNGGFYVPPTVINVDMVEDTVSKELSNINLLYCGELSKQMSITDSVSITTQTSSLYSCITIDLPLEELSSWNNLYTEALKSVFIFRDLYNDGTLNDFIESKLLSSRLKKQLQKMQGEDTTFDDTITTDNVW